MLPWQGFVLKLFISETKMLNNGSPCRHYKDKFSSLCEVEVQG